MIVADQLAPGLDHAARLVLAPDAAAHAFARFEDRHVAAMSERVAGHQPAEACSNDCDSRPMPAPRPIRHQARRRHGGNDGGVGQGRADQPLTIEANELGAVAAVEPRVDRAHQKILGSQSEIEKQSRTSRLVAISGGATAGSQN
jgi:hypothetical protein